MKGPGVVGVDGEGHGDRWSAHTRRVDRSLYVNSHQGVHQTPLESEIPIRRRLIELA